MKVRRYFSHSMQDALRQVREDLGPDAVILSNKKQQNGIELLVTMDYDEQQVTESLSEPSAVEVPSTPSASELARRHAEKSMKLQEELDRTRQRLSDVRGKSSAQNRESQENITSASIPKANVRDFRQNISSSSVEGVGSDALMKMQEELRELKNLISQQASNSAQDRKVSVLQERVADRLSELGTEKSITAKLVKSIAPGDDYEMAWARVRKQMFSAMNADFSELIDLGGVVALVGPTGSGKTMTIGKLAARYVMRYGADSLALVTTDRYRIAAHEQLKVFGRILNVPVHVVDEENSLDDILDHLSDRQLVLVDTAGLMKNDRSWTEQLKELKMSAHQVQNYLVMPATGQYKVMRANYEHYKMVGLAGTIITKLDEAVSLGETLSYLIETRLSAAYFTDGQRVPEDIHLMDKELLLNKAEDLLNSSERWVTISARDSDRLDDESSETYSA
jgi:flagellar biosynthesis protein FlhF